MATITPSASKYTKHANVSSTTANACLDQLEQEIVAARNVGNQSRVHLALRELQKLAIALHDLHL